MLKIREISLIIIFSLLSCISAFCQESTLEIALNYEKTGDYDKAIDIYKQLIQDEFSIDQICILSAISACYAHIEEKDSTAYYAMRTLEIARNYDYNSVDELEYIEINIENVAWRLYNIQQYSQAKKASDYVLELKVNKYGEGHPECTEWLKIIIWESHKNGDLDGLKYYSDRLIEDAVKYHDIYSEGLLDVFEYICCIAEYWACCNPEFTIAWISNYYDRLIQLDILYRWQCRLGIILHSCSINVRDFKIAELLRANLSKCYYEKYFKELTIDDIIKLDSECAVHAARVSHDIEETKRYIKNVWDRCEEAQISPSSKHLLEIIGMEISLGLDDNLDKIFEISNKAINAKSQRGETSAVYYLYRSYFYEKKKDYNRAILDIKCAVSIDSAYIYKIKLGNLYFLNKEYEQAIKCFNELYEETGLPDSIKIGIDERLSILYWINESWEKQSLLLDKLYDNIKSEIYENIVFMTEHQITEDLKDSLLGGYWVYDLCFNLNERNQWPFGSQMAYNFSLLQKGLILNIQKDIKGFILADPSKENRTILDRYKSLLDLRDNEILSWDAILPEDRLELIENAKQQSKILVQLDYKWKDIRNNLNDDEVAIEFINLLGLRHIIDNSTNDEPSLCALIIRSDSEYPFFVKIANETSILNLFEFDEDGVQLDEMLYSGELRNQLYHILWEPLIPYLVNVKTVYYSPSGILHNINLDWLGNDIIGDLCDKYDLYRLSSTREICSYPIRNFSNEAILYGDISYSINTLPESISSDSNYRSRLRDGFCLLNGTAVELDSINKILRHHNIVSKVVRKEDATEISFREISGVSPRILHIATHGFYYASNQNLERSNDFLDIIKSNSVLYHSGLALAGAQDTWRKIYLDYSSLSESINNDGILFSSEITELDLSGTDLVVLSACETARGDIAAEGVYGLQRAFKQAGANSLIMSLWKVDDDATQLLMTSFYRYYLAGMSKREALVKAQRKVRNTPGYEDPEYWAAFILLDGLN